MSNPAILIAVCFTLGLLSSDVRAQDKGTPEIDKSQAAARAQKQYRGKVLKVDQSKEKYRVKVLQNSGRVINVDVDKRSGNVSKRTKKKKR